MTLTQQIQCDQFINSGYDYETARILIERGAWLQNAEDDSDETRDAVENYRDERDAANADSEISSR